MNIAYRRYLSSALTRGYHDLVLTVGGECIRVAFGLLLAHIVLLVFALSSPLQANDLVINKSTRRYGSHLVYRVRQHNEK